VAEMETKKKVEKLFKYYHEAKQNVEILRFQIANFAGIDDTQVIESLNYSIPEGERVTTSNIADKSSRIALIYKNVALDEGEELLKGMMRRYIKEKNELEVFEHCITLLEQPLSDIITDLVMNRMTWIAAAEKYHVHQNMVDNYRKKAIKEITRMIENVLKIA
jgi:hypothetical protein